MIRSTTPFVLLAIVLLAGCGGKPGLHPVSGKVTFKGGKLPPAEIAIIRFEPVTGTTAEGETKGASGDIQPDGTYQLTTLDRNDGAYAGDYKVSFTIVKTYQGQEPLIDKKFTTAASTPHSATVTAGGANRFDFEVTTAPGM